MAGRPTSLAHDISLAIRTATHPPPSLLAGALASAAFVAPSAQTPPPAPAPAPQAGQPPAPADTQQIPPVTFRAEIEYVEVDAVVTDERANLVKGLTREDFEVYEDGKLQKVAFFSPVVIPVERLDRFVNESRPIVPDVRSNARPFEGRIYVLLLDNHHTAALRSALVKKAAHEFIDKYLGANDVAAVIHTSGATDAAQEFTNDPRLLHAVDRPLHRPEAALAHAGAPRRVQPQPDAAAAGAGRRPDRPRRQGPRPARPRTRLLRQRGRSAPCAAWPISWGRSGAGARRS